MSEINLEFGSELGGRTWALKSGAANQIPARGRGSDLMSEMVTRVADAICRSYSGEGLDKTLEHDSPDRDWYMATARAAIEAMREPTEAQRRCPHAHKELNYDSQQGTYYRCLDCQLEWSELDEEVSHK